MSTHALGRRPALLATAIAAVLAAALAVAAHQAMATTRAHVLTTARNATLGKTVLVTTKGATLYSLSVERHGRFVCTGSCASVWHPLLVTKGAVPTGVAGLGTIARPGSSSRVQVTFHGLPLYTFTGDHQRGDAKGEGFRDVGVWHAASTAASHTASSPPAAPSGGYGSGY